MKGERAIPPAAEAAGFLAHFINEDCTGNTQNDKSRRTLRDLFLQISDRF